MTAFGLRKDAKVKTFMNFKDPQDAVDAWEEWMDQQWELASNKNLSEFDDVGDALGAMGWDGYQVPSSDFDVAQDYWVILNRRAMVAVGGARFESQSSGD